MLGNIVKLVLIEKGSIYMIVIFIFPNKIKGQTNGFILEYSTFIVVYCL